MKKVVLAVIGVTALCLHSMTQGEGIEGKSIEELCRMLEENFDDPEIVISIMRSFYWGDGLNPVSYGHQEALGWARRVVRENRYGIDSARRYLALKGDARDLDILSSSSWGRILKKRVAGTNILDYGVISGEGVFWHGCYPSVANMGPQAFYAEVILYQAWRNLEKETHDRRGVKLEKPVRDWSKIPAELMTVVVWFDEDGNPVCNVDLDKYGIDMHKFEPPQHVKDEIQRIVAASRLAAKASAGSPGTPSPYLLCAALAILAILTAAAVWRLRKRGRK